MTRSALKFVLIGVLALLQCFAPLLHAHAGGVGAVGAEVHLHADEFHSVARFDMRAPDTGWQSAQAYADYSTVISMAREFKPEPALFVPAAPEVLPSQPITLGEFARDGPCDCAATVIPHSVHRAFDRPFSQAPPFLLSSR